MGTLCGWDKQSVEQQRQSHMVWQTMWHSWLCVHCAFFKSISEVYSSGRSDVDRSLQREGVITKSSASKDFVVDTKWSKSCTLDDHRWLHWQIYHASGFSGWRSDQGKTYLFSSWSIQRYQASTIALSYFSLSGTGIWRFQNPYHWLRFSSAHYLWKWKYRA